MENSKLYLTVKTTENTVVQLRKDHVSAVEQIPASRSSEAYLKLYVAGYSFNVAASLEEIMQNLNER